MSASGFTEDAKKCAEQDGMSLTDVSEGSIAAINSLLRIDLSFLWCPLVSVGREGKGLVSEPVIKNIDGMNHWRILRRGVRRLQAWMAVSD